MTLIRTGLLNAVAVGVRLLSMLVLNKILAVLLGPSSYGIIGQLQNAVTAITAIASAGVGTGVTKYTAEYCTELQKHRQVWMAATFLGLICSLLVGIFVVVLREELAFILIKDRNYSDVFIWLAFCLIFYVLNVFLLAVLNGLKELGLFIAANIINSFITLAITGLLAWLYGLHGALVALAINQSLVCFMIILMLINRPWFKLKNFIGWPNKKIVIRLGHFTLMAITTSVLGPLSQIIVRNILISKVDINAAGYWEAMTRISNIYLTIISTTLTVYLIPKLSELKDSKGHKNEIKNAAKIIFPVTALMAIVVYTFRDYIVRLLFSPDFVEMEVLFGWQMVGDVVRSTSWILSFYLLSQSETKKFIFSETLVSVFFVASSYVAINSYGLIGSAMGYTLSNIFYAYLLYFFTVPMLRKYKY